jgi:hypothetical protein
LAGIGGGFANRFAIEDVARLKSGAGGQSVRALALNDSDAIAFLYELLGRRLPDRAETEDRDLLRHFRLLIQTGGR